MTSPSAAMQELAQAAPGPVKCRGNATITGLAHDSRVVKPGDLFFCVAGAEHDGHQFASEAVNRGAVGLVVEHTLEVDVPQVETASVRQAMGPISSSFYGHPSHSMMLVGVTGTNGKTTVCSLVDAILSAAGVQTEVLGTLSGSLTTPESVDLQYQLARWRSSGTEAVAMEVSSHALHQHRVDGVRFDVAVFTNLTSDHLDYHDTAEAYFAAKARLFGAELSDRAVVNVADEYGERLAAQAAIPMVGYNPRRVPVELSTMGLSLQWRGQRVQMSHIGRFNAANAVAAAEASLLMGAGVGDVVAGLESAAPVPGRFEMIETWRPFTVIVDYAHTPDGLNHALVAARELVTGRGRLRLVFGCGGDRDTAKRPMMGRVAADLADQSIITSDNPRSEDPEAIIADVLAGVPQGSGGIMVQPDRRAAIARSLADASDGDVVVIAGKGHETTQVVGDRVVPFDDRQVAQELLSTLERCQ